MSGRGDLPPSGFGSQLRQKRDARGWTQKQLGDAAGVHPNTIAKLERGENEPAWPMVLALAKALGVDCTAFSVDVAVPEPTPVQEPEPKKPAPKGKPKK